MGRPEFETVVASAPREKIVMTDIGQTVNLGAGIGQVFDIYAPAGYVGEVIGLYLSAPVPDGAASGTHTLVVGFPNLYIAKGVSPYNAGLMWYYNYWYNATSEQHPPSGQTQSNILKSLVFDDSTPLRISYTNGTNVTYAKNLALRVYYKLRQVAG